MAAIAFWTALYFIVSWGAVALFLVIFTPSKTPWGTACVFALAVLWPFLLPVYFAWIVWRSPKKS